MGPLNVSAQTLLSDLSCAPGHNCRYACDMGLTRSLSPTCTVTTAPLANPQTNVIGNVGSHRSAVTGETFTNFLTVSQDCVAVMRIKPFSQPLARYAASGEKRRTLIELVCPESVSTLSNLWTNIWRDDKSGQGDFLTRVYVCTARGVRMFQGTKTSGLGTGRLSSPEPEVSGYIDHVRHCSHQDSETS